MNSHPYRYGPYGFDIPFDRDTPVYLTPKKATPKMSSPFAELNHFISVEEDDYNECYKTKEQAVTYAKGQLKGSGGTYYVYKLVAKVSTVEDAKVTHFDGSKKK